MKDLDKKVHDMYVEVQQNTSSLTFLTEEVVDVAENDTERGEQLANVSRDLDSKLEALP